MSNNNTQIPKLILAAEPAEVIQIPNFFLAENNAFYSLLKEPPYLRYMGWNMLTLDTPKIKQGECWEVTNGEVKLLRLYKDGSFIAIAYANQDFLGWGQKEEDFLQNPRLNTLAIVEFVTEFVELYRLIIKEMPSIKSIRFKVGIKNSQVNNKKLWLSPRKVTDLFYGSTALGVGKLEEDFLIDHSIELKAKNQFETPYVAFELLALIFEHFQSSPDNIPYTSVDKEGKRFVKVDEIRSGK